MLIGINDHAVALKPELRLGVLFWGAAINASCDT